MTVGDKHTTVQFMKLGIVRSIRGGRDALLMLYIGGRRAECPSGWPGCGSSLF